MSNPSSCLGGQPVFSECRGRVLERCGPHCSDPATDLGGVFRVHLEEMTHRRPHRLDAGVIELHPNFAVKNFERWAVPVLDHIVVRGKALVDKRPQVLTDRFASMPISHAEVAHSILSKAVEAFAKGLVINFFPHGQKPFRSRSFREGYWS
jgi:hypothetical protein